MLPEKLKEHFTAELVFCIFEGQLRFVTRAPTAPVPQLRKLAVSHQNRWEKCKHQIAIKQQHHGHEKAEFRDGDDVRCDEVCKESDPRCKCTGKYRRTGPLVGHANTVIEGYRTIEDVKSGSTFPRIHEHEHGYSIV